MTPFALPPTARTLARVVLLVVLASLLAACGRNMSDQPKAETYEASPFFADGASSRPLPEGAVSRERGGLDPAYLSGQDDDGPLTELPIELTTDLLLRGQERYNIYCAPCHNYDGGGDGMVVQKGFVQPTSFHEQRLLDAPVGYYYNAITNGFGRMYSYASRIPVEDRWAIAGYVKALQLSQNATLDDVPDDVVDTLRNGEAEVR